MINHLLKEFPIHVLRMSRLFVVVLFLQVLTASLLLAEDSRAQGESLYDIRIELNIKNTPLIYVFDLIEDKTDFNFSYHSQVIDRNQQISLESNSSVGELLEDISKRTKLRFKRINNNIHIYKKTPGDNAVQEDQIDKNTLDFSISGRITDENGEGLPGVNVLEKGTTNGTVTDLNGDFRLDITDENAILIVSFVGYEHETIAVNGRSKIDIQLFPNITALQEIVVIGYGTVQKSDLTGSVGQITMDDENDKPAVTVEQFLQGRVSGVQITQGSGAPGGAMNFLVRGGNSLANNQPLIVIDGYPIDTDVPDLSSGGGNEVQQSAGFSPLANLNPNDIASIEILKDASSTAIYGSRGANGVVLITTKKGKLGDGIEFNYRFDASRIRTKINVLNTDDFIAYANEGAFNEGLDSVYTSANIAELSAFNFNWQDEVYETAYSHDYQLVFSGRGDRNNYALILNHSNNNGIIKNSGFDRSSARLNYGRKFSDALELSLNTTVSKSTANLSQHSNRNGSDNIVKNTLFFRPFEAGFNPEDGEINDQVQNNPLILAEEVDDITENLLVINNLKADFKITKDLTFTTQAGFNSNQSLRQVYYPGSTSQGQSPPGSSLRGNAFRSESNRFNYLIENTLNYQTEFGQNRLSAVAGYTWQEWSARSIGISAKEFFNDNLRFENLGAANIIERPQTRNREWALSSFLARVNYALRDKYLFTFTGRADGSTRLAEGEKWDFFPSAAVGWKLHEEGFMSDVPFLETLKLRASYGLSGNQSVAVGDTQVQLNNDAYVVGGEILQGLVPANLANPILGWETTSQWNIGADVGILDDRVQLEVNYYRKVTKDLLVQLPVPNQTGFGSFTTNAGTVENKGLELDLTAHLLSERAVDWKLNGNISFNRNEVSDLGLLGDSLQIFGESYLTAGSVFGQPIHVAQVGSPVGAFYGFRIDGIYQNEEEVLNGPEAGIAQPGDFRFVDINGDSLINDEDKTIIGDPNPDFVFGLINDISYKQWSLSFYIQGVIGNEVANLNRYRLDALSGTGDNVSQEAYDNRWRGEGTSNTYPRIRPDGFQYFNGRFSDFLVEDASFVRLKNITLSYSPTIKGQNVIKSLRVFVTATNLLTITNYSGHDPDVSAEANNGANPGLNPAVDNATYPSIITLSTGVNVRF